MKKFFAVLAAALTLANAGVASAQDHRQRGDSNREWRNNDDHGRRGDNDDWRRGGRGGEIVVRDLRGRTHTFTRRDREYETLLRSPFGFRPGILYVYTDDCRRGECQVYLYERGERRARSHLWAPTLNDPRYFRSYRNVRWGDRDNDRDWDRDRDRDWN